MARLDNPEAGSFRFRKQKNCTINIANTKATVKLHVICAFVFTCSAECSFSHDEVNWSFNINDWFLNIYLEDFRNFESYFNSISNVSNHVTLDACSYFVLGHRIQHCSWLFVHLE